MTTLDLINTDFSINKAGRYIAICLTLLIILAFSGEGETKVTGTCSNCHTMHNRQNGNPMAYQLNAGKTGFVPDSTPNESLLISSCVGCHTSTGSSTIVNNTPIVFNTGSYPSQPLAGGNFYNVSRNSAEWDKYGHNVLGIVEADRNITTEAPGNGAKCGDPNSCHATLTSSINGMGKVGCEGCHFVTYHHEDNNVYRFLQGHDGSNFHVEGVEDPDWEQNPTLANHNIYKGFAGPVSDTGETLETTNSISTFCSGCHWNFHRDPQIGSSSPWFRHPADIILPSSSEYSGYDPLTDFNVTAPVAYTNPLIPSRATATVMCLSCHRAHASSYAKIMRWDYKSSSILTALSGCNICHTGKN